MKYIWSLFFIIYSVVAWGQGNGFDPSNPPEPSPSYQLHLLSTPRQGGYFNMDTLSVFEEGAHIYVRAYPHPSYEFVEWRMDGKVVSTSPDYEFSMKSSDIYLTGVFQFNPENPGSPGSNLWNATSGELMMDDFVSGGLNEAAYDVMRKNDIRSEEIQRLTIIGEVSSRDLRIVREWPNCAILNLKMARGISVIDPYLFEGLSVTTIVLPIDITAIYYDAFANCINLSEIICYAVAPPRLDSGVLQGLMDNAVARVPQASIALYQADEQWGKLTILPLMEEVSSLEVTLPEMAAGGKYKNMSLELVDTKTAQRLRFVVTDRMTYTFSGLAVGNSYHLFLKDKEGTILGEVRNIAITEKGAKITFTSIRQLHTVKMKVQTEKGIDVTKQTLTKWYDAGNKYITQGDSLTGLISGTAINYWVEPNSTLGSRYVLPTKQKYTVVEDQNLLSCTLQPIDSLNIEGVVQGADNVPISGAMVAVSQLLNGKYSKSVTTKTDREGKYKLMVYDDVSTITISLSGYVNQTMTKPNFSDGANLGVTTLTLISGATITTRFTYTKSVASGGTADTKEEYANYQNVTYNLFNRTQNKEITQYSVQYPSLVLLEPVDVGDELVITATSRVHEFEPVQCRVTLDKESKGVAQFDIVELGSIQASYTDSGNELNVALLYSPLGQLIKQYPYSGRTIRMDGLADGSYVLVSMASNRLFNSILNLSELSATGLVEKVDFVKQQVAVKSGLIAQLVIPSIPLLEASKLNYTDSNTSFRVNKPSIVVGNYLTLRSDIKFKESYQNRVSEVKLIVDLPDECSFVNNSILIGNSASVSYTFANNQLILPLSDYSQQVRFCIVATKGGSFAPNAFVEFTMDGTVYRQPIGAANFVSEDLSLYVPAKTARKTILIRGTAIGNSEIKVYDNEVLIGQTKALANGSWTLQGELKNPYSHSYHDIYAEITTLDGLKMVSENKKVIFDENSISVSKVTMINNNSSIEFDFLNPATRTISYSFNPSVEEFTFKIEFTKNDPLLITDVMLNVLTSSGSIVPVQTVYDVTKKIWVATRSFDSMTMPINVGVSYSSQESMIPFNMEQYNEGKENILAALERAKFPEDILSCEILRNESKKAELAVYWNERKDESLLTYTIESLNYSDYPLERLNKEGFNKSITVSGDTLYSKMAYQANGSYVSYLVSINGKTAFKLSNEYHYSLVTTRASKSFGDFLLNVTPIFSTFKTIHDLYLDTKRQVLDINTNSDILTDYVAMLEKILSARCPDGSLKYEGSDIESAFKHPAIANAYSYKGKMDDAYNTHYAFNASMETIFAVFGVGQFLKGALLQTAEESIAKLLLDEMASSTWKEVSNFMGSAALEVLDLDACIGNAYLKNMEELTELKEWILSRQMKCKEEDPEPELPSDPSLSPITVTPILDPSGYVYEAVPSNRLQGVTTTVYQKSYEEDMYGEMHEKVELWNAEEYAQENPLTTDENGMYAWDVPAGWWQVKYEKEGYQTAYSDWLPVPPPQLDVNVGMVQSAQPDVLAVRGYEGGIEVDFTKFMQPSTLTIDQIIVTRNNVAEKGELFLLNEEANPLNQSVKYASKVRFVPVQPFAVTDQVVLTVSRRVKSYAGINMESDFSQMIDIKKEAKSINVVPSLLVANNRTAEITVSVEPIEAAANKKIIAFSTSTAIATVTPEGVLDEKGQAVFTVSGELLGSTMIQFAVEGMALKAEVKVHVLASLPGEVTHNYALSMGWNWCSFNVADLKLSDPIALFAPIQESIVAVKGETEELINGAEKGLQGSLDQLKAEQTYKIRVKKEVNLQLIGRPVAVDATTITLHQGWNWIGYVPAEPLSLPVALANLTAEKEDVIKGLDCFAMYNGTEWVGSLTKLLPGEGYMYYSHSVKSFNYAATGMETYEQQEMPGHWNYDAHQSEDNMIVLAQLFEDEQQVVAGKFLIAAFVGDECRGVAFEKDGYQFLTIHGAQEGEQVTLKAFDTATDIEYFVKEKVSFSLGLTSTFTRPLMLHLGDKTDINEQTTGLIIYPNPVKERLYLRGDFQQVKDIRIINLSGRVCIAQDRFSEEGIEVSSLIEGVYFVVINTGTKVIRQKFIKLDE